MNKDLENWKKCMDEIESQILPSNFEEWVKPLVFGGAVNGHIHVTCIDKNHKSEVGQNYGELLESTLTEVFKREVKVRLITQEGSQ